MPIREPVFDPPFNVVRSSHVELGVRDLGRSRAFYVDCLGLLVSDETDDALYLRGLEERNHHSIVLRRSREPDVQALGFKLASEEDLDRAAFWFGRRNLPTSFPDLPHQGRTLRTADVFGMPLDLYAQMDHTACMLQQYSYHQGARIQRIDHLNCFTPDVQASYDFYRELGFRLTEYTETDGADAKLWAVWMHRKGNVHDLAFTNGVGPRLHHIGVWTANLLDIIHLCDVMATSGYLQNMERGPGRHGISNAFFLYIRDPDVHVRLSHRRSRSRADPLVADRSTATDFVGPSGAGFMVQGRIGLCRRSAARAGAGSAPDRRGLEREANGANCSRRRFGNSRTIVTGARRASDLCFADERSRTRRVGNCRVGRQSGARQYLDGSD
jgi:catechol 2,3-dioxygenase